MQNNAVVKASKSMRLEDLHSDIPAYVPGENPPTRINRRRTIDLKAAKRYVADCVFSSAGQMQGYGIARAIQQATTKEELIAQLDAVCSALVPYMRAVARGRMVDHTLVLLGEAG